MCKFFEIKNENLKLIAVALVGAAGENFKDILTAFFHILGKISWALRLLELAASWKNSHKPESIVTSIIMVLFLGTLNFATS